VSTGVWWGNLEQRKRFEDTEVDKMIILKFVFKKYGGGRGWTDVVCDSD
jgi:hypothetical protein